MNPFVEIHHEHLILFIAHLHKRQCRGEYIGHFPLHAPAVVHNYTDRDRNIFMLKDPDGLLRSVFVNLEIVLCKSVAKPPLRSRTVTGRTTRLRLTES